MSSKFIYVKLANKKSAPPKKVVLPSSLSALKKAVTKLYNLNEPIGAFKNQQDEIIEDVRNILEGSLILVILKSKMDREGSSSVVSQSASMSRTPSKAGDRSDAGSTTSSVKLTINKEQPKPTLKINMSSANSTSSKAQTPTIKLNANNNKNSLPVQKQNITPKSAKTSNKQPAKEQQNVDEYSDEYEASEDYSDSGKAHEYDYESATEGEELFKKVIPSCRGDFADAVNEAFLDLSTETNEFLTQAIRNENSQKSRYFNELFTVCKEFQMFDFNEDWIHLDKMRAKARSLISQKRIATTGGYTYVMKAAILGPQKSGKSTFLSVYLRELLVDLVATDNWKSTFVFPYDISQFMEGMIDLKDFYKDYVRYIFALLHVQCPSMIPLLPAIEKSFESVIDTKGHILLPRRLTQDINLKRLASSIDEIVQLLAQIWKDPDQFEYWLANLALLPKRLASAFGFKQIINVFDHFDMSNECVVPGRPFETSEYSSFPSELLKCALIQGPFILGAKDTLHFFDSLESIDENITVNLASYVDAFYLWNLIDQTLYSDKEIYVEFAQTKTQLRITSYACGGIPNYLTKWNKMNKLFDELDKLDENTNEYEDAYCELVTIIEVIVYELFIPEKRRSLEKFEKTPVANVRRRSLK